MALQLWGLGTSNLVPRPSSKCMSHLVAKMADGAPPTVWIFPVSRSGEKAKLLFPFKDLAMASAHSVLASIHS